MPTRRALLASFAALPAIGLFSTPALAGQPPVFSEAGLAIRGIDPVAYFTQDQPVPGLSEYQSEYMGAVWRFASAANKALFDASPEVYAPKYGGYCAYAVSKGATALTDPDAWTVHDGNLYLNFSTDVRSIWRKDIPGNVQKADLNWPAVLDC